MLVYTLILLYMNHVAATIAGICFFLIWFIPESIIHLKYYLHNRSREYSINRSGISIENKNGIQYIPKEDIRGIMLKKPANLQDGWDIHLTGITCYYYLKITLNDDRVLYLTNLLDPHIDKILAEHGYSYYREKGIAWI